MVPRQYYHLMARRHDQFLRNEFGPALITATVVNLLSKKKHSAKEFMPSWREKQKRDVPWQELLAKVKYIHNALGGTQ
jgi:hypothetical protein